MKTIKELRLQEVKWTPAVAKKHAAAIAKMKLPGFDAHHQGTMDALVAKMKKAKSYSDYEDDIEAMQDRINRKQAIEIAKLNNAR
jgi:hypothetical protein|tara:strand:+ start:5233 stop:5487 length:255 start_codon:yes stop_codon:yes gene_type:complete